MRLTKAPTPLTWLVCLLAITPGCDRLAGCHTSTTRTTPAAVKDDAPANQLQARREVAQSLNEFTFELHRAIAGDGNLVYSPLSIDTVLSMSMSGAAGETAEQMRRVLRADGVEDYHAKLGALSWHVSPGDAASTARISNDLWVHDGFALRDDFRTGLAANYGASVFPVDLADPEATAETINEHISDVTSGYIENAIPAGDLGELTHLVLTNAVYFDAEWEQPFDKDRTRKQPFLVSDDEMVQVDMMNQEETFRYAFAQGVRVVELPYSDGNFSAVGILPRRHKETLAEVEARLDAEMFATLREELERTEDLPVSLPRVRLSTATTLTEPLRAMGMRTAFAPDQADFSETSPKPLFISQVRHAAVFELDETGTVFAASTTAAEEAMAAEMMPEFIADRPFLLFVIDNSSGAIVFVARVVNPSEL